MIEIRTNLSEAIDFLKNLEKRLSKSGLEDSLPVMGHILVASHKQAFDEGGHEQGKAWAPTGDYWKAHLKDKGTKGPLNWTGYARESISFQTSGGRLQLRAAGYLGKFQFGPFSFTETFPVQYTEKSQLELAGMEVQDDYWLKLPESDSADRHGFMTRNITVQEREVFGVYDDDVQTWLDVMASAWGLA